MADFHLLPDLPRLIASGFKETSPQDPNYNCIAWAAGDTQKWWWPDEDGYWPVEPREETLESFLAAFSTLGYSRCQDGSLEQGFEKIVIYQNSKGPQHAAKQLPNGKWSSKLGRFEDIEHDAPESVDCDTYGRATIWLKRPIAGQFKAGVRKIEAKEPRNPLYFLLLLAGLVFILTALAYAVVPVLEEKAKDQGVVPPESPWRDTLRLHGWKWLLWEAGALVVLGLACMGLDRYWRHKKDREAATAPPSGPSGAETAERCMEKSDAAEVKAGPDQSPAP